MAIKKIPTFKKEIHLQFRSIFQPAMLVYRMEKTQENSQKRRRPKKNGPLKRFRGFRWTPGAGSWTNLTEGEFLPFPQLVSFPDLLLTISSIADPDFCWKKTNFWGNWWLGLLGPSKISKLSWKNVPPSLIFSGLFFRDNDGLYEAPHQMALVG